MPAGYEFSYRLVQLGEVQMPNIDVQSLLDQLDILRRLDSRFRVFGASKHRYQLQPPAMPEKLREFERQHTVQLPADYFQFLSEVSNGGTGPNYGVVEIERAALGHVPSIPFLICEAEAEHKPNETTFENRDIPGAIWLSDNGCATFDIMVVNGPLVGNVWTILEDERTYCCSGFQTWYFGWLKSAIRTLQREPLLKSVRTGMHIEAIRNLLGDEIVPVPVEFRGKGYGVAFSDCNAHFFFDSKDQLQKMTHLSHIICPRVRT